VQAAGGAPLSDGAETKPGGSRLVVLLAVAAAVLLADLLFAQGLTIAFTVVAVAVVVVILRLAPRLRSTPWAVALGLVLGGAVGNLTDRIFRAPGPGRGHVVDFLELPHWPVFNLADSAIVTAACLMVLLSARGSSYDGTRATG